MLKPIKAIFTVFVAFSCSSVFGQPSPNYLIEEANKITGDDFRNYMAVLAHDSLEGRNTGTVGYDKAATYIVDNLIGLGIEPAGNNNSYFQNIPIEKRRYAGNSFELKINSNGKITKGDYGKTVTSLISFNHNFMKDSLSIVFVGNGIIDSARNINDYKDVDVRGKTVLIEASKPTYLKDVNDYSMYNPVKLARNAIDRGASGIIFFFKMGVLQNAILKNIHGFFSMPMYAVEGTPEKNPYFNFDVQLGVFAHRDLVKEIFKAEGLSLKKYLKNIDEGIHSSFETQSHVHFSYEIIPEKTPCKNVLAMIPGSDPKLRDEYIVITAHLDHVGIGKPVKKDSIYNGAWDNASGSAGILAMAKMMKESKVKPKRSVIFAWLTAEEVGLIGSYFFATFPTVPKEKIVANLNLDMMGGFFESSDILPIGYGMSNITEAIDFAAQALNKTVNDSSQMLTAYFERSDHFSFIREEIPAVFIWSGLNAVDPKINGEKQYKKWEKKYYHSPFDDLSQDFTNVAFEQGIKMQYLTTMYLANEIDSIEWHEENELYKKYILKK